MPHGVAPTLDETEIASNTVSPEMTAPATAVSYDRSVHNPEFDLLSALNGGDSSVGNPTRSITPAVNLRVC